jgi:hypothetical protein
VRTPTRRLGHAASLLTAVALLASACTGQAGPPQRASAPSSAEAHQPDRPQASPTESATFSGPNGVRARWVINENRKPGTTSWRIPTGLSGPTINGYADHIAAHRGQRVRLFVSTGASRFRVEAFRMGYYGGAGARMI